MRAILTRARSELRTSWRAWLTMAILIGVGRGAATAAAAGARRTESAYPRFVLAENGFDVLTSPRVSNPARELAALQHLPEVSRWGRVDLVSFATILPSGRVALMPEMTVGSDPRNQMGVTIDRMVLALILAAIALGTLAQTLVTSVRARRRDLAILKTPGFTRRQVRSAGGWQASTMATLALVIGLPLGVAAGRWVWRFLADGIGVLPVPVVSLPAILIGIPATVLLANLIAAFPGHAAARTKPATVLRSE